MTDITIYQAENGMVEVRLEQDTLWLSQERMGQLFGRERSVGATFESGCCSNRTVAIDPQSRRWHI